MAAIYMHSISDYVSNSSKQTFHKFISLANIKFRLSLAEIG